MEVTDLQRGTRNFLRAEIKGQLSSLGLAANADQHDIGNQPDRIIFDGKTSTTLSDARKGQIRRADEFDLVPFITHRLTFRYQSAQNLAKAFIYVVNELAKRLPDKSGVGIGSMMILVHRRSGDPGRLIPVQNHRLGLKAAAAAVSRELARTTDADVMVSIYGPHVPYRRSMVYAGTGKSKQASKWVTPLGALGQGKEVGRYVFGRNLAFRRRRNKETKEWLDRGNDTGLPIGTIIRKRRAGGRGRRARGVQALVAQSAQEIVARRARKKFPEVAFLHGARPAKASLTYDGKKWGEFVPWIGMKPSKFKSGRTGRISRGAEI